ncbi:MAG: hypothetical protein WCE98_09400 [Chlorobium sp.]|jgi:hypothetical protein
MPICNEEPIRTLAYLLWLDRGAPFDNTQDIDWLESERIILSRSIEPANEPVASEPDDTAPSAEVPAPPEVTGSARRTNRWMQAHWEQIGRKPLKQLCLPSTHDSGTYRLDLKLAPDAADLIKTLYDYADTENNATGVRKYIRGMAVCQSLTIREQLDSGIRVIDLRVCKVDGVYYCCHALLGDEIRVLLKDMAGFLSANPYEVVVVKVGLKEMSDAEETEAWSYLVENTAPYGIKYPKDKVEGDKSPIDPDFSMETLASLKANKDRRCLFLSDDYFTSNYSEEMTTTDGVISRLESKTTAIDGEERANREEKRENGEPTAADHRLFEAQCFRPTSPFNYGAGYIQAEGAISLGALAGLAGLGYNYASLLNAVFSGESLAPVPANLHENAQNSRSIVREYFTWLAGNPHIARPQVINCDYFQEVPLVDIAIQISIGQQLPDLSGIQDIPVPELRMDWFTATVGWVPNLVAFAAMLAGVGCCDLGRYLDDNIPGITGDVLGAALKGAGYACGEVAQTIHTVLKLTADELNTVLRQIGYASDEIEQAFVTMGEGFVDFFSDAEEEAERIAKEAAAMAEEAARIAAEETARVAEEAARQVEEAARIAAREAERIALETARVAEEAARATAREAERIAREAARFAEDAARATANALNPSRW